MMSKHSEEEKFEIVMESLAENITQAEICRRHGIFLTLLNKWKQQFLDGGSMYLRDGRSEINRFVLFPLRLPHRPCLYSSNAMTPTFLH